MQIYSRTVPPELLMRFLSQSTALLNRLAQKVVRIDLVPRELTAQVLDLFWANKHACPSSMLL
ncbi:MAG: hypothetical protein NTX72_05590 [Candidatus Uhrbacteria bacterium]|nr:hypothetical protein [Candidatus Uhrbacteria bacterium]